MTDSVIVCNGCCCGNTKKEGHNAVPTDFLETEWERQGLAENIKLKISDCLGPCSMHNVALLKTNEGHTWIGKSQRDRTLSSSSRMGIRGFTQWPLRRSPRDT